MERTQPVASSASPRQLRDAGERGARPASSAAASNLDELAVPRAAVRLRERGASVVRVAGNQKAGHCSQREVRSAAAGRLPSRSRPHSARRAVRPPWARPRMRAPSGSSTMPGPSLPRASIRRVTVRERVAGCALTVSGYDTAYGHFSDELYAAIRQAAFGEDIGQNSWLTADELRTFCEWLGVDTSTELLEVASGSGGPALFTVETTGCRLFGVDLHDEGVAAANRAAQERGLADRARFVCVDARKTLPVDAGSFDAVICIDSINHMYERSAVLREWRRVLRPSGRVLFTDPITVTGLLRREEMILRGGAMGEFVFTPPGLDQRLLEEAGFAEIQVEDRTPNMAAVAGSWRFEQRAPAVRRSSTSARAMRRTPATRTSSKWWSGSPASAACRGSHSWHAARELPHLFFSPPPPPPPPPRSLWS